MAHYTDPIRIYPDRPPEKKPPPRWRFKFSLRECDWIDGVALVGLIVLVIGGWLVAPALGLGILGAVLIGVSVLAARPPAPPKKDET